MTQAQHGQLGPGPPTCAASPGTHACSRGSPRPPSMAPAPPAPSHSHSLCFVFSSPDLPTPAPAVSQTTPPPPQEGFITSPWTSRTFHVSPTSAPTADMLTDSSYPLLRHKPLGSEQALIISRFSQILGSREELNRGGPVQSLRRSPGGCTTRSPGWGRRVGGWRRGFILLQPASRPLLRGAPPGG